jgi:hypothetical protein
MLNAGTGALEVAQYLVEADGADGRKLQFVILKDGGCAVLWGKDVLYVGAGDENGIEKGIDVLERTSTRSARGVISSAQTRNAESAASSAV